MSKYYFPLLLHDIYKQTVKKQFFCKIDAVSASALRIKVLYNCIIIGC